MWIYRETSTSYQVGYFKRRFLRDEFQLIKEFPVTTIGHPQAEEEAQILVSILNGSGAWNL